MDLQMALLQLGEGPSTALLEYGLAGVFILVLIGFIYYQRKDFAAREKKVLERVAEKDRQIADLNKFIRTGYQDSINVMRDQVRALDNVSDRIASIMEERKA